MRTFRILRSPSNDIFLNLAIEDRLFRTFPLDERVLFLWSNDAAVVIGRYQNPWIECRTAEIARDGVALARRQSGGGTVWHDRGNLCFTFMSATAGMDKAANIDLVVRSLRTLGLDAGANDRLDVLIAGRKVSGSAFRESGGRSFHHGTLLVRADLDALERYLASGGVAHRAKGVKSVRAPVANLVDFQPSLTVDHVEEALAAEAAAAWGDPADPETPRAPIQDLDIAALAAEAEVIAYRDRLAGREWRFGASPPFALRLEAAGTTLTVEIEAGAVRDAAIESSGDILADAAEKLMGAIRGREYDARAIAAALRTIVAGESLGGQASTTLNALASALEEGRFS